MDDVHFVGAFVRPEEAIYRIAVRPLRAGEVAVRVAHRYRPAVARTGGADFVLDYHGQTGEGLVAERGLGVLAGIGMAKIVGPSVLGRSTIAAFSLRALRLLQRLFLLTRFVGQPATFRPGGRRTLAPA